MTIVVPIVVLCLICLVVLRSFLDASDRQSRPENHWVSLQNKQSRVEAEITADGGTDHCMTFEPDLMRNLASIHLQNGETQESAAIYSKLWTADRKNDGVYYNRQFVEDALGLADVYQAQGSHMQAITCYRTVLDYDMGRLKQTDPIVARDFNNLGVAYYLAANTKQDSEKAKKLYDASEKMYVAALAIADQKKAPFLVSTINRNRSLTIRDYGPRSSP